MLAGIVGRRESTRPSKGSQRIIGCSSCSSARIDRQVVAPDGNMLRATILSPGIREQYMQYGLDSRCCCSLSLQTFTWLAGPAQAFDIPFFKDTPQILSPGDANDIKEGKVNQPWRCCCATSVVISNMPHPEKPVFSSYTMQSKVGHMLDGCRDKTPATNMLTKQRASWAALLQTC